MACVAYVDRRDTLDRLARVFVVGDTAVGWLAILDPTYVREISDQDLARLVGGSIGRPGWPYPGLYPWTGLYPNGFFPVPSGPVVTPGAFGAGAFGSGPFGGAAFGPDSPPSPPAPPTSYTAVYGGTY